jgi:hypothetical protein
VPATVIVLPGWGSAQLGSRLTVPELCFLAALWLT